MLLDDTRGVIRLVPRDLHRMHLEAKEHGEEVNIAVAIGLEPNVLLAGATSVDFGVDELTIASALRYYTHGTREIAVRMPNGVHVPYNSEIVLVGKLTNEYVDEGPFVDITGTYDVVRKQPVVVFERMYYRTKTLHLLISGGREHYNLMGMPREPTIFRAVRDEGVDVLDVRLTPGGCSWLHAVVKIRKRAEDDGRRAIYGAFKGHRSLKHVVVVDEDIDIDDPYDVEFAIATRFQGDRDLVKMGPTRGSSLDPSAYEGHMTIKLGLDATMPLEGREKFIRVKNIN
jgi:UbiD family decarboxylase